MATGTIKEIELYDGNTQVYPKTYLSAIDVIKTDGTQVTLETYIQGLINTAKEAAITKAEELANAAKTAAITKAGELADAAKGAAIEEAGELADSAKDAAITKAGELADSAKTSAVGEAKTYTDTQASSARSGAVSDVKTALGVETTDSAVTFSKTVIAKDEDNEITGTRWE